MYLNFKVTTLIICSSFILAQHQVAAQTFFVDLDDNGQEFEYSVDDDGECISGDLSGEEMVIACENQGLNCCTGHAQACEFERHPMTLCKDSCIGRRACQFLKSPFVGTDSCLGDEACRSASSIVGDGSCGGRGTCKQSYGTATIGNDSCNGRFSCRNIRATVGDGSCNNSDLSLQRACRKAKESIGNNSCNGGLSACEDATNIGNNSCNDGDSACQDAGTIFDNTCNGLDGACDSALVVDASVNECDPGQTCVTPILPPPQPECPPSLQEFFNTDPDDFCLGADGGLVCEYPIPNTFTSPAVCSTSKLCRCGTSGTSGKFTFCTDAITLCDSPVPFPVPSTP